MKKLSLILVSFAISLSAYAKTQNYILVGGSGVDDLSLMLKNVQGKTIHAYCDQKCGKWFDPDEEIDGQTLKKQYFEKKVQADIKLEKNAGRVAGPSDDESFYFIKHIKLLK
ncbi:hypothetical protein ACDX34_00510 [Acinetobacter bereziniae]|uniref:hypothetical protein n=1 Tax=Acinetobacter bereziniae TaxID=106648 RepID=UPI0039C127E0